MNYTRRDIILIPILRSISIINDVDNVEDFISAAVADITTEDSKGADCFYFRIVTPKRLVKLLLEEKILLGRAVFIVNELDMESIIKLIKAEINGFLPSCSRETWEEVALAINYYLEWEFYDPACGICEFYKDTMEKIDNGTYARNTLSLEEILLQRGITDFDKNDEEHFH